MQSTLTEAKSTKQQATCSSDQSTDVGADVETWRANWLGYVRGEYGDEAAEEAA